MTDGNHQAERPARSGHGTIFDACKGRHSPFSLKSAWKRSLLFKIITIFLCCIMLAYSAGALVGWAIFIDAAKQQWQSQARINTQIASATLRSIYTYIAIETDREGQVKRIVTSQPVGDDDSILFTGFAPADVLALVSAQTNNETWLLRYERKTGAFVNVAQSISGGPVSDEPFVSPEEPLVAGNVHEGRFAMGFAALAGETHYVGLLPIVHPDKSLLGLVAVSIGKAATLNRAQNELVRNSFTMLLAILALTGILVTICARRLFRPVPALVQATLQIAGEVTDKITPFQLRSDEIGDLARAIEALREAVVERARLREIRDMTVELEHMAHHDALTGLGNRALLMNTINEALEDIPAKGFNVILLDLDRFKVVNDTLGHASGDLLLKTVSSRISLALGAQDLATRLGGDEFAIVQRVERDAQKEASTLATRLLDAISAGFLLDGHEVAVGTSIGIACAPHHGVTASQLLQNADLALYRAKAAGRGTAIVFEQGMDMVVQDQHALEMDLRFALQRQELELHYQPIVSIGSGDVEGFEALLRWRHPQLGLIPPGRFIPLAEETGIIVELGEWVLERATQDATTWPEHIRLAVNLSPIQLRQGSIVDTVMKLLGASGLAPSRLELEVTESVLLGGDEGRRALETLRSRQVSIVLDDFGTGYASLMYLAEISFSKLKIDQGFVRDLHTTPASRAIVGAIVSLARELNIETTAEGVETEEQLLILKAAGCSSAQGYFFAKPKPIEDIDRTWESGLGLPGLSRAV